MWITLERLLKLSQTFVLLLLVSCINERVVDELEEKVPFGSGKMINLKVNIPRSDRSTYSSELGSFDENHIDTIFINILEDGVVKETQKLFGSSLYVVPGENDSIVTVSFEAGSIGNGSITTEVFANRMEILPISGEIPLPDKTNPETCFIMTGSGPLTYNGTSYSGEVHVSRNVAKLRILISKNTACIPENLIINYSDIKIEAQQVPDRTQLMSPPPILTPPGLTYISFYPRTGAALRPVTPIMSFTGGQIDSLYLNENYLDDGDYTTTNKTQIKITVPSQEPGMPVKTDEYTYQLYTEGSYRLKRNFIYTLSIKIAGQSLDPIITLDVLPWNDIEVNGDINGVFLSLDRSVVPLSVMSTKDNAASVIYKTDNTSVTLDWSKIKPEHNIDTTMKYIQGRDGNIEIFWNENGAPDFDFRDTVFVQAGNIIKSVFIDYKVPYGSFGNWVGTFHRWNRTGERIIKMRNTGEWTATVTQGAGFIILDAEDTNDSSLGTSSAALGNDINFDMNYSVTGNRTTLTGSGIVYFRVGLKSMLAQADTSPRYGLIEVTTNNGVKKIYVRQGEEADYIMRPEDTNPANGDSQRTYAAKFSPFNLTDPTKWTGGNDISLHNAMPLNESSFNNDKFTEYPSQAGYFFHWNLGDGGFNKAFNPVNAVGNIMGWNSIGVRISWNIRQEPCPQGYYHPNDNKLSPANSEMRQSLYLNPNSDAYGPEHPTGVAIDNSEWGFYADGFYDRLPVVTSTNGNDSTTVSYNAGSLSSIENTSVGYSGLLIYNPATNASIFLPAAGTRNSVTGALEFSGNRGGYWTNTYNGSSGMSFFFTSGSSYLFNNAVNNSGLSVRCVKFDSGLPGSL